MLVINANNQQDTTNYMLAEPWYPDIDSILMRGGPQRIDSLSWSSGSSTGDMWGLTWQVVVDTIGTEPINYYCPKFYKQGLLQWNVTKTKIKYTDVQDYLVDYWFFSNPSSSNYEITLSNYCYRIAVKWLQAWQVIGEKIFAYLMFMLWTSNGNARVYLTAQPTIEFWLLHTDGTKTVIATISPSYVGGTRPNTDTTQYIIWPSVWQNMYITALMVGSYNGTWQTAQNGDILYATVDISWIKRRPGIWMVGLSFWGTNNISPWDLDWFRPFQVSIRDS